MWDFQQYYVYIINQCYLPFSLAIFCLSLLTSSLFSKPSQPDKHAMDTQPVCIWVNVTIAKPQS